MESVDAVHFRRVLSSYPTGVVVVCADAPRGPVGMSCNSFTAVSLSPPLIAVCPADTSTTWPGIREAGRFCVSVLASDSAEICAKFARKGADRFAGVDVRQRSHGPAIGNAAAWIDCELYDEIRAGDHTIALGRVVALEMREEAAPLVFWASKYGTVAPLPMEEPMTTTPSTRYRMPVGFGPAPGPRQKADGTEWTAEQTGTMRQEFLTVDFLGRAAQLQRLLPPGFRLRGEPVVSVQLGFFRDLYWLAGRGYGVLMPLIPVTYEGRTETIEGNYMPVIWEGLADAIVTGRDELGFPKLAADFPDLDVDLARGSVTGAASWLGFEFFSAALTGLAEVPDARPPAGAPMITFKYVPRTSPHGAGGADIAHVTTGAAAANGGAANGVADSAGGYRRWEGAAELTWHHAKFEQLPTTFHVVNGLADLDVVEYRGAAYFQAALPGHVISGAEQRAVDPAEDLRHAAF